MIRRLLVYAGLGAAALAASGVLAGVFYLYTVTRDLPSVTALQNYSPPVTTRVYAGNGTVIGEYARESRIFVPAAFIPKLVKQAFTSAEDRNFYNHPGIDPSGILRAAVKDVGLVLEGRRPQGASTITQQVARNFLLNSDVKFSRKIREAILAIRIDATYPKDKVLELYLNEIYLGEHSYGVAAAALNYFGKSLDDLDISEVAFLAAHLLWMMTRQEITTLYDMITIEPAKALNLPGFGLAVGAPANFVVLGQPDEVEALRHHAQPAHVISHGRRLDAAKMQAIVAAGAGTP